MTAAYSKRYNERILTEKRFRKTTLRNFVGGGGAAAASAASAPSACLKSVLTKITLRLDSQPSTSFAPCPPQAPAICYVYTDKGTYR
jgi:hypothetical protein